MKSPDALRRAAEQLRQLADRAPTWRQRNEFLRMAREYDELAELTEIQTLTRQVSVLH